MRMPKTDSLRQLTAYFLTALCVAVMFASPAGAKHSLPIKGGSGDAAVVATCPSGEMLVGFKGRLGLWVDQIQIMCAKPMTNSMGAPHAGSDQLGGFGGSEAVPALCPRNSRLHTATVDFTAEYRQVARIHMICASLVDASFTKVEFSGSYHGVAESCGFLVVSCSPEEYDAQSLRQACPQEQFVGANFRVGQHVNAIGFICDAVAIPGGSSPIGSAVGGVKAPGANLTFTGTWKMVTKSGGHFDLTLSPIGSDPYTGRPVAYTGILKNTDGGHPEFDGTFQGTMLPGGLQMQYTYVQPGLKSGGSGTMGISGDGKRIDGNGVDSKAGAFTWGGPRK